MCGDIGYMKFSDLSLGKKITGMLILPIIGFLWFGLSSVFQSLSTTNEMAKLTALTKLSTVYSSLVHELQKERGATAGFIGSQGRKFSDNLKKQRQHTNDKINEREAYWRDNKSENSAITSLHNTIDQSLQELVQIRSQVDSQSIKIGEAIGYYTHLNKKLLSVSSVIAEISTDAKMTNSIVAYYNFLQGKERAGIERAVMSNTFSEDKFAPNMFVKFITLVSEQETYFDNYKVFANEENNQYFKQQLENVAVKEVLKLRKIALDKSNTGQFEVDAEYWFEQSTMRIGQLKKIEDQLSTALIAQATEIKNQTEINCTFSIIEIIAVIVLVAFVINLVTKDLQQRVTELNNVMSHVRNENNLTFKAVHTGKSELGEIATSLNNTLDTFSGAIKEISSASMTLSTAAEETAQTCEHNSASMQEQQSEIALVATAVEELSATVKEVACNTQLTADSAKEADGQAQKGLEIVKISYHSIERLAEEITGIAARITSLHESSQKITSVVDVIKSIADQTNLLALNAAIEAARAGEQGRGFAVVADEVRTLAQRTQDSTKEIESFITTLQSDANSAFNVIEQSQQKASEAVENSKNVENSLADITKSINSIFAMTEQVAAAVEEQAVVTQDVAQNVVSIEQKSMSSTAAATQIATTAKEQAMLASSLQDIAGTFTV